LSDKPGPDAKAAEVSRYLSGHLRELGVNGWTISVTRGGDSATQIPDGPLEPEDRTEAPGGDDTFGTSEVLGSS
jgi:hypothetical protein